MQTQRLLWDCKGLFFVHNPLLKVSKGLKVLRGCKAEPCWIQKAKPFAGMGRAHEKKSIN